MSTKYTLQGAEIHREGVKIATRDQTTGTIDYLPDCDRYRAPVSAWLKEIGMDKPPVVPPEVLARQKLVLPAGQKPEEVQPETVTTNVDTGPTVFTARVISDGQDAPESDAGPSPEQVRIAELEAELARARSASAQPAQASVQVQMVGTVQNANVIETQRAQAEQVVLNRYYAEGAPKMDAQLGDKTPEFVRWLCKRHPDDARVRYNNRRVMGGKLIEEIITEQN